MRYAVRLSSFFGAFAALMVLAATPARAQPVPTVHMTAELAVQGQAVAGGETYVAIHQKMEKGWHTYWRNTGDSGLPTTIEWTLPAGWKAGEIVWPTPHRLPIEPLMNYGYEDEVLLPVPISVPASAKAGETVTLKAKMSFLICSTQCVPGDVELSVPVTVAAGAPSVDSNWGPRITRAVQDAPRPAGLKAALTYVPGGAKLSVTGDAVKGGDFADAYFFPYAGGVIDYAQPQPIERGPDGVTLTLPAAADTPARDGPVKGVLSIGGGKGFEIEAVQGEPLAGASGLGAPKGSASSEGGAKSGLTLPLALVFAFLGGLILNLMPCVFPILSMKAAALARHAHEPSVARKEGLAFLAGVLVTFLALAGALIAAKAGGAAVGWGFQLQSPPVIAALALLMLLVALNLSGLFEIGLSAQGAGSGLASKSGLAGSFFTGALAVVVAAPCTAPFMATALGYAVSQPPALSLLIFASLGLGFAAPFVLIAFAPALLSRLPRPGAWMEVFKTALAFPMYAAAAWLAWVFTVQTGEMALPFLLGAGVVIALGAWLFGLGQKSFSTPKKIILQLCLPLAVIAAAVALAPVAKPRPSELIVTGPAAADKLAVEVWSADKVAALQGEGKVVFVDFTAAWCVTCQVNERTSLASASVAEAFKASNAVYMKADWTNRDAVIAAELEKYSRAGVPLYLVFPAGGGEPKILPQLLTEGIVKNALEAAKA